MKNNNNGKIAYVKFGKFHGQKGKIVGEVHVNGADRFLIKLQNGLTITKKQKNVILFGGVQSDDRNKKK